MAKVQPLRLKQCFGPFTMFPVEEPSETRLFRHVSNHLFQSPQFLKYISYEDRVLLKMFKL